MIGWRGVSRYLDPDFIETFDMELEAISNVMQRFDNITMMIPFVRHPKEAKDVTEYIRKWFESRTQKYPKMILMAEVPSITLVVQMISLN